MIKVMMNDLYMCQSQVQIEKGLFLENKTFLTHNYRKNITAYYNMCSVTE